MAEKKQSTFKRKGLLSRTCPWCWKHGLAYLALKKSVKFSCVNGCDYYAWVPKRDLSPAERKGLYSAKSK